MAVLSTACKKSKDESLQPVVTKNLVEMNLSNGVQWKFDYNSSGRLTNAISKYTNTFYQQQLPFLLKHTYLNSGDVYEFRNAVKNADGRIISADRFYNGTLQSKLKFKYNADGYLINMLWERVDIVGKTELHYYY